jgi:hypothetical protein
MIILYEFDLIIDLFDNENFNFVEAKICVTHYEIWSQSAQHHTVGISLKLCMPRSALHANAYWSIFERCGPETVRPTKRHTMCFP